MFPSFAKTVWRVSFLPEKLIWGTTLVVLCRLAYWWAGLLPRAPVLFSLPPRAAPQERRNPVAALKGVFFCLCLCVMGAYKANSGPSEEGGRGRRYWVGECLKQCRVFWVRVVFHFMVLQLSGLLRSSQEAMSYFEHASSPGCVSLSASDMPCFLLQMHFFSLASSSPANPWRNQAQPHGCTGIGILLVGPSQWVFKEQFTWPSFL